MLTGKPDTTAEKKKKPPVKPGREPVLPDRKDILEFLAKNPGQAGKREIARAFGISGGQKIALKRLLRELKNEGLLQQLPGRKLIPPGALAPVGVITITSCDKDGELVAEPSHWKGEGPAPHIIVASSPSNRQTRNPNAHIRVGERAVARLSPTTAQGPDGPVWEARIIRRIGQEPKNILGIFRRSSHGDHLVPADKRARDVFLIPKGEAGDAQDGDLVLGEPLPGARRGQRCVRVQENLGPGTGQKSISRIALHAHDIPHVFPETVLEEARNQKPAPCAQREDLRSMPFITIDPEDAKDHDDAVWAAPDTDPGNPDGYIVCVAIADVAAYVTPHSLLDQEARKRGNSTYLPDRVVPMLPENLSENQCSLRVDEDRPCMAVRLVFDRNGHKKSHRFLRGLMRSVARLSYADMQRVVDGTPDDRTRPLQETVLQPLWNAYQCVAKARDKRAPLALDLPEYRISLDKKGRVHSIRQAERFESMRLIEEFMIQANVAAAETLEEKRAALVYRVHDAPSREKTSALSEFLDSMDMKLPRAGLVKPAHFNNILDQARQGDFIHLVSDMVLRTQSQALYAIESLGHFGLNLRRYTHFTSPIRRYADLLVHRALIAALNLGNDGQDSEEIRDMSETAEHISFTERRSMLAERDTRDRLIASWLEKQVGAEFGGRISGVTRFGLFIKLTETGADGLVPVSSLGKEYFRHDEATHTLTGERTGLCYRLGEAVQVRLREAVPVTGGLALEITEGGTQGAIPPGKKSENLPKRGRGERAHRPRRQYKSTPKRRK